MTESNKIKSLLFSLLFFLFIFFGMLCISSVCVMLLNYIPGIKDKTLLLISSVVQNVVAFGSTSFIASYIFGGGKPITFLELNNKLPYYSILGIIICFFIGIPMLNEIIYLNSEIHLPDFAQSLEIILRKWEDAANLQSQKILSATTTFDLIANLLIIGVLTGTCEELLFRGTLQNILLNNGIGNNGAIWITAVIFSAMHLQFFGFVPRVLLGAFFGYLLVTTRSIYAPIMAHIINNSLTVVVCWLINNGYIKSGIEEIGVVKDGIPFIAIISLILFVFFCKVFWRKFFKSNNRILV